MSQRQIQLMRTFLDKIRHLYRDMIDGIGFDYRNLDAEHLETIIIITKGLSHHERKLLKRRFLRYYNSNEDTVKTITFSKDAIYISPV